MSTLSVNMKQRSQSWSWRLVNTPEQGFHHAVCKASIKYWSFWTTNLLWVTYFVLTATDGSESCLKAVPASSGRQCCFTRDKRFYLLWYKAFSQKRPHNVIGKHDVRASNDCMKEIWLHIARFSCIKVEHSIWQLLITRLGNIFNLRMLPWSWMSRPSGQNKKNGVVCNNCQGMLCSRRLLINTFILLLWSDNVQLAIGVRDVNI